jgi:hypothetical protein
VAKNVSSSTFPRKESESTILPSRTLSSENDGIGVAAWETTAPEITKVISMHNAGTRNNFWFFINPLRGRFQILMIYDILSRQNIPYYFNVNQRERNMATLRQIM